MKKVTFRIMENNDYDEATTQIQEGELNVSDYKNGRIPVKST